MLVAPNAFILGWVLLALLTASAFAAWFVEIPSYDRALAAVVDLRGTAGQGSGEALLIILPGRTLPHLKVGQRVFLAAAGGERVSVPVLAVEDQILSPRTIWQRYGLDPAAAARVTEASAVALAPWAPRVAGAHAASHVGSVYEAQVETGARRVISLIPGAARRAQR
jgi:hypothetical protein